MAVFDDGGILTQQISVKSDSEEPMVRGGDSGSALIWTVEENGVTLNKIVGLVVGEFSNGRGLIANHIHEVISDLSIQLDV